ncbi:carbamate kinase [Coriobacteriaceae bacterium EMTCatB1]|nr:carbamate kinase [Coriobacteriaceae bacterium EMTCatB1]
MSAAPDSPLLVIALGGNAILRRGDDGTIETQFRRADESMQQIVPLVQAGAKVVLTHGNGPVVGNIVVRNEAARDQIPPMPLYIADADSEGGIGFMLETSLTNALARAGSHRRVVTVVTRCVVDPLDPAFQRPTKPIGPYYTAEEAARLAAEEGWAFAEVPSGLMRRVVPSPKPVEIVEAPTIAQLADSGDVVIAAGGGGVPVVRQADGTLQGVDAVIDKDWASAILAEAIGADHLVILMEADRVYLGFGTPDARPLETLTAEEAERLASELDAGSVGPKVAACAHFARTTGRDAIVCAVEQLHEALAGGAGTRITGG